MSSSPQPLTPDSRATSCSVSSLTCLQTASKSDPESAVTSNNRVGPLTAHVIVVTSDYQK